MGWVYHQGKPLLHGNMVDTLQIIDISSKNDFSEPMQSLIDMLTLKALNKNCSRRHFNFLLLSFEENKT